MHISAMHRIFIQAGEIISDAHALKRPFKPTLLVDSYVAIYTIAIKSKLTRIIKNLKFKKEVGIDYIYKK